MDLPVRKILSFVSVAIVGMLAVAPAAFATQDTYTARQWALQRVHAEQAWSIGGKGKGATIAIVDSGVDLGHEDLDGAFVRGYDFVDGDDDPSDEHGHGTHVAGIAAARANNDIGVAGVAPAAKIMPVRVLDSDGSGTGVNVDAGIRWAADHGADVINLSLSDGDVIIESLFGDSLNESLDYAWSKGAVPIVVSGNDGFFRTQLASANAVMVTATGPDDTKASYANSVGFAKWAIAAPGGTPDDGQRSMVFSTLWTPNGKTHYGWAYGTSMAAPHVSGAAAILRGLGLTQQQTVDRLLSSARDIGESGRDNTYGSGLLDVAAAAKGIRHLPGAKVAGNPGPSVSSEPTPGRRSAETRTPLAPATDEAEPSSRAEATVDLPAAGDRAAWTVRLRAADDDVSGRSPLLPALALVVLVAATGGALALSAGLVRSRAPD